MKRISTYIPSIILSVLLVFCLIGSAAALIADIDLTAEKTISLTDKESVDERALASLERYYREKAGSTGIPSTVYTDNITIGYVREVMEVYIRETFSALEHNGEFAPEVPKNPELESAIEKFFNDYADETGYEKDEKFEKKLESTINNAYRNIGDSCDIFKVNSMNSHGLLKKVSRLYSKRWLFTWLTCGAAAFVVLLFLLLHRKRKCEVLYWGGVSALIAGITGFVPCLWLISKKYYDSFTIKQPQVFRAYTKSLYKLTEIFMAVSIAIAVIGLCMITVYIVIGREKTVSAASAPVSSGENNSSEILTKD